MSPPRNIAPARPGAVSLAKPPPPTERHAATTPHVSATDVIFVNGQAFNGRGYEVCGVANQRGRLCGRIGACPFHHPSERKARKRARSPLPDASTSSIPADTEASDAASAPPSAAPVPPPRAATARARRATVRQMDIPPQKSRFKRSWTTDEHRIFLHAMRLHGKGKWKEIATEVKTRTANQCQSHAQKYFLRQAKTDAERKKKSIHDVTEEDVVDSYPHHHTAWSPAQSQPPTRSPTTATAAQTANLRPDAAQRIAPARSSISEVPLAPRRPLDLASATAAAAAAVAAATPNVATGLPASTNASAALNITLGSDVTENLATWNGATTAGLSNAALSAAMAPNGMVQSATPNSLGNGMPIVQQSSSSMATVPVVLPMSAFGNLPYSSMISPFINSSLAGTGTGAVAAPPPPPKLRVTVHVNGKSKGGMALMLPTTLEQFFELAQSKFQFNGVFTRVFTRSGGEITSLDEMCQDDMLWLSTGADFLTPR